MSNSFCNSMDYSPPESSVHGISEARILEWIVDCHFFIQGIFPNEGSNSHVLYWQDDSLPLSHQEARLITHMTTKLETESSMLSSSYCSWGTYDKKTRVVAIPSSNGPCFVRTFHSDSCILVGLCMSWLIASLRYASPSTITRL